MKKLKSFFLRGLRGWSPIDTWSFDTYLAKVIFEGVSYLRINTHSYAPEVTEEEWDKILRKIEVGFKAYGEFLDNPFDKEAEKKYEEAMKLFSKWFEGLWR